MTNFNPADVASKLVLPAGCRAEIIGKINDRDQAAFRFVVHDVLHGDVVSVYYDDKESLGYYGGKPYWEAYPGNCDGDIERCNASSSRLGDMIAAGIDYLRTQYAQRRMTDTYLAACEAICKANGFASLKNEKAIIRAELITMELAP